MVSDDTHNYVTDINRKLVTVTKQLDDDFHRLLEEEDGLETELKTELRADQKLREVTNTGLQVVDQLEKIEQKINQHERAAEKGMNAKEQSEILGYNPGNIKNDIKTVQNVVDKVKVSLETFEEEQEKTSEEIHTFKDITNHIQQGKEKIAELDDKLANVENKYRENKSD